MIYAITNNGKLFTILQGPPFFDFHSAMDRFVSERVEVVYERPTRWCGEKNDDREWVAWRIQASKYYNQKYDLRDLCPSDGQALVSHLIQIHGFSPVEFSSVPIDEVYE